MPNLILKRRAYYYLILTNFRAYLIEQNRQIRISRGFIFAISEKKGLKGFKFCENIVFIFVFFLLHRGAEINTRENKWE